MTLNTEEVKRRVERAKPDVVNELRAFGQMLLTDSVDRISELDTKAGTLAAYNGGMVTILISTSPIWKNFTGNWFIAFVTAGIAAFVIAAWVGIRAVSPKPIKWFSDKDWLRAEFLDAKDDLCRYWVLATWELIGSHQQTCRDKVSSIQLSVWTSTAGFVFLALAFLQVAWTSPTVQSLWIRIR